MGEARRRKGIVCGRCGHPMSEHTVLPHGRRIGPQDTQTGMYRSY